MADLSHAVDELRLKLDATTINSDKQPLHDLPVNPSLPPSTDATFPNESSHGAFLSDDAHPCYDGSESFDGSMGEYQVPYAVFPVMDPNFAAAAPFYDPSYMQAYPPYAFPDFQNPSGEYAFVNQPFPVSMSSEMQGSIAYGFGPSQVVHFPGYQQVPAQAVQYSPYNAPLHPGGVLMYDSQDALGAPFLVSNGVANMMPFAGSLPPPLTLPTGAMMMVDPGQAGVVVSNSCPGMTVAAAPIISMAMPLMAPDLQAPEQQPLETISTLNARAGPFTPANAVLPCEEGIPVTIAYPAYNDGNAMALPETWDASRDCKGSQPCYFYSPMNSIQSYGSATVVHLTPESGAFTKNRVPLLDVTTNLNSREDDAMQHKVKTSGHAPAINKERAVSKNVGERCFPINKQRSRVEWAPVAKNMDSQKVEAPVTEPDQKAEQQQLYNRSDFVTNYEDAKFFIIKSFSEANIRQSVTHKVWSSTHHGNRKLDQAYEDAQCRPKGKPNGCPLFLFFSVNGSGQFCGVAEMVGRVDYTKTMDCWDRERWGGSFPVKWHIIKNVPNFLFHGIILRDNENKPVTNSRDTQEVNLQQGLQMLGIFKKYYARSWILEDSPIHQSYPRPTQDFSKVLHVTAKTEPVKTVNLDVEGEAKAIVAF